VPLTATLIVISLSSVLVVLSITHRSPRRGDERCHHRLVIFWALGPLLVARWGSFGTCVSVVLASVAHAALLAVTMRMVVRTALGRWYGDDRIRMVLLALVLTLPSLLAMVSY
jgi:hypothetical protein